MTATVDKRQRGPRGTSQGVRRKAWGFAATIASTLVAVTCSAPVAGTHIDAANEQRALAAQIREASHVAPGPSGAQTVAQVAAAARTAIPEAVGASQVTALTQAAGKPGVVLLEARTGASTPESLPGLAGLTRTEATLTVRTNPDGLRAVIQSLEEQERLVNVTSVTVTAPGVYEIGTSTYSMPRRNR